MMFADSAAALDAAYATRIVLAVIAGLLLGLFYYGGLWWTVRQLQTSRHLGLLFAGSFLVRTVVVIGGFFLVSGGDWLLIVASLVAFIGVRLVLTRRWGPEMGK